MSETHLANNQTIDIPNYTFYAHNRKTTHKKAPKTYGGVGIFVKWTVFKDFEVCVIDKCIEGILGISFVDKITGHNLVVFNCYLPPINSVYGQDSVNFFSHLSQQV